MNHLQVARQELHLLNLSHLSPPNDNSRSHILVVDDNYATLSITELIRRKLYLAGYRVSVFTNHENAQAALSASQADLVITNRVEGPFIEAVKKRSPLAKILFCTGHSFAGKGQADDILTKPFTLAQLLNKVSGMLEPKE